MPLITITSLKGRSAEGKQKLGDAVHAAIVEAGVPTTDRFQRFLDLEPENFIYDKFYPDLENNRAKKFRDLQQGSFLYDKYTPNQAEGRSENFVIIEILFSVGRSVKVKRKILESLLTKLKEQSFRPQDVFVSFQETAWENWSFANGEILHA